MARSQHTLLGPQVQAKGAAPQDTFGVEVVVDRVGGPSPLEKTACHYTSRADLALEQIANTCPLSHKKIRVPS